MIKDTRQNIIDAAIFIFNEDLSAPLEKVADKADVTRRTLHRYFKDRKDLFACCNEEMQRSCKLAMDIAEQKSDDPLKRLEYVFYAAIDCGVKYAFLHKLHHLSGHQHRHDNKDCIRYDETFGKTRMILKTLKEKEIISQHLTVEWILILFPGVISATIGACTGSASDKENLKKLAWFSFSKGIGL